MNIKLFKKSNSPKHKKDGRINPHIFWSIFVTTFLIFVILAIVSLTYFFVSSSRLLDKEVIPKSDTNINQINKIDKLIKKSEDAILEREGE